jgi:hypothetical protein
MQKFINVSSLPQRAENILELEEPEGYSCHIWKYMAGHSRMAIEFRHSDAKVYAPIYAVFEAVDYFEGVMSWTGANFRTASREVSFELKMKLRGTPIPISEMPDLPISLSVRLFTFNSAHVQIKILASLLYLTDDTYHLP